MSWRAALLLILTIPANATAQAVRDSATSPPPKPVPLPALSVTAELDPVLTRRGFYERKQGGVGHFLGPADIEKLAPKARLVTDMLGHIPGVSIVSDSRAGARVPHLRSCRPTSLRQRPNFGPAVTPGERTPQRPRAEAADTFTSDLSLYPRVYVDGLSMGSEPSQMASVFGMLLPSQLLAVEVYMGASEIPLQYGGTDAPCGVILIWTRQ